MTLTPVPGYRSRRFVLHGYPAESQVVELVAALGWHRLGEAPADLARRKPRQVIWQAAPGAVLNYMEDAGLEISYVVVTSEHSPNLSQHISLIIENGLDVYTDQELLGAVESASSPEGQATALAQAGLGAPLDLDNRYSRLFVDSVRSANERVRLYGVLAIGYAEWAPFRELLEAVSEQDSDAQVRDMAHSLMRAFDAAGLGDTQ